MKITLKLEPETLFIIHKIALDQCQMIAESIGRKTEKSMRIELFTTLSQRCITYSSNANGKILSLTLKYHLASLLFDLISDLRLSLGVYEGNKIELLKTELHQKLI